ncbi:MAG: hypothetical protein HFE46_05035 [Clostridia bacterium]|jgi:hypothetical protein|nr:hypothetical protein [Clostridia bacterium]
MVTYYIGNIREKRFLFRKYKTRAAVADNCDVLAHFKLNGKVCFVLGDIPYGDMRVGEYLAYARALKTRLPLTDAAAAALLKRAGVRVGVHKRMRALPREVFRGVLLAAAVDDDTQSAWLNLDGVPFSWRARGRVRGMVRRMARQYGEVHVAVSDYRFIPRKASAMAVANNAMSCGRVKSASRRCGRLRFARYKRKANLVLEGLNGKKTLLCDN